MRGVLILLALFIIAGASSILVLAPRFDSYMESATRPSGDVLSGDGEPPRDRHRGGVAGTREVPRPAEVLERDPEIEADLPPMEAVSRRYHFDGYLTQRLRVLPEMELILRTRESHREVFTDVDGAFTFSLASDELPGRLWDMEKNLLLEISTEPVEPTTTVRVHTFRGEREFGGLLSPNVVTARWGDSGCRVEAYGETLLDYGISKPRLIMRLQRSGRILVESDRHFDGSGPMGDLELRELPFAGRYQVVLCWPQPEFAPPGQLERVRDLMPEVIPGEVAVQREIYMGSPRDEVRQEEVIERYYEQAWNTARVIRAIVFMCAERFRESGPGVSSTDSLRIQRHELGELVGRIMKKGPFSERAWRKLLDEEVPEATRIFRDSELVPYPEKHPDLAGDLAALYRTLNRFIRFESQLVYSALGKDIDHRDFVERDHAAIDEWNKCALLLRTSIKDFRRDIDNRDRR